MQLRYLGAVKWIISTKGSTIRDHIHTSFNTNIVCDDTRKQLRYSAQLTFVSRETEPRPLLCLPSIRINIASFIILLTKTHQTHFYRLLKEKNTFGGIRRTISPTGIPSRNNLALKKSREIKLPTELWHHQKIQKKVSVISNNFEFSTKKT